MGTRSNRQRLLLIALVAIASLLVTVTDAAAAPKWAPAESATIHPGVRVTNLGGLACSSNFVFANGSRAYLGMASHCTGQGLKADGCADRTKVGELIRIEGARYLGQIVYDAWTAQLLANRARGTPCDRTNDFALVRIDQRDRRNVNPSVPVWGGPTGVSEDVPVGAPLFGFASSSARPRVASRQIGLCAGAYRSWQFRSVMLTPTIPGDSGSLVLGPEGGALGHVRAILEPPGNLNVRLARVLDYMYAHSRLDRVRLAEGTVPFSPVPVRPSR